MDIHIDGAAPLLVFGGPYSNLQATEAMYDLASGLGIPPQQVICTGDVVAYCAEPEETASLIRDWGCHVIQGNCEENLAARLTDCGCGFAEGSACDELSKNWFAFADAHISEASRAWMAGLPRALTFTLGRASARVTHGGVSDISRFIFASTPLPVKQDELAVAGADIVIAGHCGLPFAQPIGKKLWFGPGVVGMPANDATRDGWYGLIEPAESGHRFSIRRLAYDAQTAADRLRDAGAAPPYAEALVTGLWPSLDILPQAERAATGKPLAECTILFEAALPCARNPHSRAVSWSH